MMMLTLRIISSSHTMRNLKLCWIATVPSTTFSWQATLQLVRRSAKASSCCCHTN